MSWKERANAVLATMTGYEVKSSVDKLIDGAARETIACVRARTMTRPAKLHALILATRYLARYKIPGDIVECGVWRGGSMQAIAHTLVAAQDTSRHLYLFDTFEGMPPPSSADVRIDG